MNRTLPPSLSTLSYDQIRAELEGHGPHIYTRPLPDPFMGFYDEQTQSIVIDASLAPTQKRCVLAHELMHWAHGDDACRARLQGCKVELRARRQAAMLLIDPVEYMMLEAIYDGNPYLMASDMDVTVQTLLDYQSMALEA